MLTMDQKSLCLPWKLKNIASNSFFPLKMFSISDKDKVVFVLLGTSGCLTFPVKINSMTEKKTDDGFYFNMDEKFDKIVLSRYQTFVVSEMGSIYSFGSYKKLKILEYLEPVQAFGYFEDKFVTLRSQNTDLIFTIYFNDFPNDLNVYKTIELIGSTDVISTEASRDQDKFLVRLVKVTNSNLNFFKNFATFGKEIGEDTQILLFSISNKLFLLRFLEESDDFDMEVVGNMLANIKSFEFFNVNGTLVLLVLTENSILTCFQFDHIIQTVDRQEIFLSGEITSYEFIKSKNTFVYSSETEFVEVKVKSVGSEPVTFDKKSRRFLGIQAMTFVPSLNSLVAINWNKMFYLIRLSELESSQESIQATDFYELDDFNLATFDELTNKVFQESMRKKILEKKFDSLLKSYKNLGNFDSSLKGISFTTSISENLKAFDHYLKENLAILEIDFPNLKDLPDLKISIEFYDPKTKIYTKKIQKLFDIKCDQEILESLKFVPKDLNVKVELFQDISSECIKIFEVPKK